jgi:hypothetical protein
MRPYRRALPNLKVAQGRPGHSERRRAARREKSPHRFSKVSLDFVHLRATPLSVLLQANPFEQ